MKKSRVIYAAQPCAVQNITETNPYGIDPIILSGGWGAYIEQVIVPELDWLLPSGGTRILIHNPFMVPPAGRNYQFDQFLEARKLDLITAEGFEDAWKPIISLGEVIFYIGEHSTDQDFLKRKGVGRMDNYLERVIESVRPFINIGGSVGFDMTNHLPAGEIEYESLDVIRAMLTHHGGSCYIEPIGNKNLNHLMSWPSITAEALWVNRTPEWCDETKVTGEIVRWVTSPEGGDWGGSFEQLAARFIIPMKRVIADGHTVCGPTNILRLGGFSVEDLYQ